MPQRLIADGHLLPVLRASTDVRAALMEAYIAGIYFSYPPDQRISVAMPILEGWLREMYDPLFDFFYTYMRNEHDQHQNAIGADQEGVIIVMDEDEVNRVNMAAMGMTPLVKMYAETYERELTWEEDKAETTIGPLFKVKCIVDGMELGEAMRASKKDAKNVAAWEAAKKLGLTVSRRMLQVLITESLSLVYTQSVAAVAEEHLDETIFMTITQSGPYIMPFTPRTYIPIQV